MCASHAAAPSELAVGCQARKLPGLDFKPDGFEDEEPGAAFQVEVLVQRLQQHIDLALLLCKDRGRRQVRLSRTT